MGTPRSKSRFQERRPSQTVLTVLVHYQTAESLLQNSFLFSDPTFQWGRKIMICDSFFQILLKRQLA